MAVGTLKERNYGVPPQIYSSRMIASPAWSLLVITAMGGSNDDPRLIRGMHRHHLALILRWRDCDAAEGVSDIADRNDGSTPVTAWRCAQSLGRVPRRHVVRRCQIGAVNWGLQGEGLCYELTFISDYLQLFPSPSANAFLVYRLETRELL